MKKLSYLLVLCVAVFFASCSSCSHKDDDAKAQKVDTLAIPTEFEQQITGADTAAVKELVVTFIEKVKDHKFYDAASMVYRQEEVQSKIIPRELNNEEIERLVKVYQLFPVVDYSFEYIRFREKELNEVCVSIVMQRGKDGQPDAVSKMYFNPIYFHNAWHLVLDDSHQGTDAFLPPEWREKQKNEYHKSAQYHAGK